MDFSIGSMAAYVLNPVGIPRVDISFHCHRAAHAT